MSSALLSSNVLGVVAEDGPVMLAIDDAQWVDAASAAARGRAAQSLVGPCLLRHERVRAAAASSVGEARGGADDAYRVSQVAG